MVSRTIPVLRYLTFQKRETDRYPNKVIQIVIKSMNKIKQDDGMSNDTGYVASFDISVV